MHKIKAFSRQHWFGITIFLVIIVSSFLRFLNYENRWGLAYDQAHDALVARHAIQENKVPLLGPFSSAGPFQTGGVWYWFIMLSTILYPQAIIMPWVALTVLYVFFVLFIILLGKELVDKKFGIFVGILSAVSTAQITQGLNLTNQSLLALVSLLTIWSGIRYVWTKETKFIFLLGLSIGLASAIHLQGAVLLSLFLSVLIFGGIPKPKNIIFFLLGFVLPWVPVLFVDMQNNFFNSKNMLNYYLYDQYKVSLEVLGRRWLTYTGIFWPNVWGNMIGGNLISGYILITSTIITLVYAFVKKKINKNFYIILISFFISIIVLRYTRTTLFDSYLVFLHPFVLLLTGLTIYFIYSKNIFVGLCLFAFVIVGSVYKDIIEIKNAENFTAVESRLRVEALKKKFPNDKFSVYSYQYKWVDKNVPLALFLDEIGKIHEDGRRVGIVIATNAAEFNNPIILGSQVGYKLIDLNSYTSLQLAKAKWVRVNPIDIYVSTQEWYKEKRQ